MSAQPDAEPDAQPGAKPAKSAQTRALIVETALRLFHERGFDKTTMRAVAGEAGVSVGNAYYYFASKEHLIQGFYDQVQSLHAAAAGSILAQEREFESRLRGTLLAWLDVAAPYHEFAAQFFKNAADPASPLSPFSAESAGAREASIGIFQEVLAGAGIKVPPDLRAELPYLLWLYHMGIVLYWVHDDSVAAAHSRQLVDRTASLVAKVVNLARYRIFRPVVVEALDLVRAIGPGRHRNRASADALAERGQAYRTRAPSTRGGDDRALHAP